MNTNQHSEKTSTLSKCKLTRSFKTKNFSNKDTRIFADSYVLLWVNEIDTYEGLL